MSARGLKLGAFLLTALLSAAGPLCAAEDVAAVLTAKSGPYLAAYQSFAKELGRDVPAYDLPDDKPGSGLKARVVVAFGSVAALQPYAARETVIVCLAPGLAVRSPHGGPFSFVSMRPPADVLLQRLRSLQPGLRRLAVIWNSENTENYVKDLRESASARGIQIVAQRASDPGAVPDLLRALVGKADAVWLAPDPRLVTPEVFQAVKQFSWDNSVPFYAPTAGLVAAGAAAAVSVSSEEIGKQAAEMTREALQGRKLPELVYPEKTELTVNLESARKAGLTVAPDALGQADQVIR